MIAPTEYELLTHAVPAVATAFEEDVIAAICPAVFPVDIPITGPVVNVVATAIAPYFNSITPVVS